MKICPIPTIKKIAINDKMNEFHENILLLVVTDQFIDLHFFGHSFYCLLQKISSKNERSISVEIKLKRNYSVMCNHFDISKIY